MTCCVALLDLEYLQFRIALKANFEWLGKDAVESAHSSLSR
jgi:hypothetical protein